MGKTPEKVNDDVKPAGSPLERQLPNVELDELVRQQGGKPFAGFEAVDALWTPEFNFDGFDEWYRQYKAEQRAMPRKGRP
jgi:hypothetical protein